MKIRKIAAISLLVLSSFAANNVAPSKTELEAMYDKAFKEFDASNYEQALKELDGIDARQPDLAESANLRGVILMRQKDYGNAEKALRKALDADPKFWNARFNLAEVPFLQTNWAEARKRFQDLLSANASDLQGEARQLIQYKILMTYLMEGKENMVEATINKFELAPDTPAVHYAKAALALNKKDEAAAKEALTTAEKTFSPQLNKLFAESLYEVGFLEKPAGQARAALELNSAAEKAAKSKAVAKAKFDEAEQALQQRDFTAARRLIDEADSADPNQAPIANLRGEIFLEQKDYDAAEKEFTKAAKLDPKYRDAQYSLALIPFKKGDYTKARERLESLFSSTSGADKDRAAQLIKYKVYLTYLLEGKDPRAQKMMEQFQFTGDTPALYYAQAAWEFKHGNGQKANDWVTSARKIYSPALNGVFSDAFYDLGWLQSSAAPEASPAPAIAEVTPMETVPLIEPTPIPNVALAQNQAKPSDPLTEAAKVDANGVPGMEATISSAEQTPAASSMVGATASPSVETPVASTASPAAARPVVASSSEPDASPFGEETKTTTATISATPATTLAPATVRAWTEKSFTDKMGDWLGESPLLVGALLLAGILLIAWVVIPELRRRIFRPSQGVTRPERASKQQEAFEGVEAVAAAEQLVTPTRLAGGPPQISLQLRASEPALRRAVMPGNKNGRGFGNGNGHSNGNGHGNGHGEGHAPVGATVTAPAETFTKPQAYEPAPAETFEEGVGEPQTVEAAAPAFVVQPEPMPAQSFAPQPTVQPEPAFAPEPAFVPEPEFASSAVEVAPAPQPVVEETFAPEEVRYEEPAPVAAESPIEVEAVAVAPEVITAPEPAPAPVFEEEQADEEPIGQGQPIPFLTSLTEEEPEPVAAEEIQPIMAAAPDEPVVPREELQPVALAGMDAVRHPLENSPAPAPVVSTEPTVQPPTHSFIMPAPTPSTPAPVIRTGPASPMGGPSQPGAAPMQMGQPQAPAAGGMHTAVQLTFPFEIASLQLTSSFKMGALQLKPTSKVVTMRLAPSQHPQPAMNLQVTFEIATVQLNGNALGMIRLTPSQAQRPGLTSSPSFNIAGLQLVSGEGNAPVQLTPSQQGQASVLVTAPFQIATVEFSPSFDIASIVLNATSKNVHVQLPGAGAGAIETSPVFEMTNVQIGGNGEIGMMQLHPQGGGAAPAPKQG